MPGGDQAACTNLRPPVVLDAAIAGWGADWAGQDAMLMVNLLHLIPDPAALAVLAEAAKALAPGGRPVIYGPFLREGQATSDGDAAFDASLRAQDPGIGYKDLDWVAGHLAKAGLHATGHRDARQQSDADRIQELIYIKATLPFPAMAAANGAGGASWTGRPKTLISATNCAC